MEEWNFYWKITALIFGATGIWKIVELLISTKLNQKFRRAEIKNLDVQAQSQITGNWMQWSERLEKTVKVLNIDLEKLRKENLGLKEVIEELKEHTKELISDIKTLREENLDLKQEVQNLKQQLKKLKK